MPKQEEGKELKVGDSTNCFLGAVIRIPIETHFAGDYRLEYDGKYISLYGRDKRKKGWNMDGSEKVWYEEWILVPLVLEVRKATPTIKEITDTEIVVDLGCV